MEYLVTGSQPKVKGCPSNLPTGRRANPVPADIPHKMGKGVPGQKTKGAQGDWSEVLSALTCAQVLLRHRPEQKTWARWGRDDVWHTGSFLVSSYTTSESSQPSAPGSYCEFIGDGIWNKPSCPLQNRWSKTAWEQVFPCAYMKATKHGWLIWSLRTCRFPTYVLTGVSSYSGKIEKHCPPYLALPSCQVRKPGQGRCSCYEDIDAICNWRCWCPQEPLDTFSGRHWMLTVWEHETSEWVWIVFKNQ